MSSVSLTVFPVRHTMLTCVSRLNFQFLILPSLFCSAIKRNVFCQDCLSRKVLFWSWKHSCKILQFLQGLVFASPNNWDSCFRPTFVGRRIQTLHLLWLRELPLFLSVFHAFIVSLKKAWICSFLFPGTVLFWDVWLSESTRRPSFL